MDEIQFLTLGASKGSEEKEKIKISNFDENENDQNSNNNNLVASFGIGNNLKGAINEAEDNEEHKECQFQLIEKMSEEKTLLLGENVRH